MAQASEQQSGEAIEVLEPPEMARKGVEQGVQKATLAAAPLMILALLAGIYIALGGLLANVVLGGAEALPHGVAQLLAGIVFTLGLILVILGGAELFTGNVLLANAAIVRRISVGQLLRAWGLAYVGNFAGSVLVATLAVLAAVHTEGDGAVGAAALDVAHDKSGLPFMTVLICGILANFLVCLAVWLSYGARSFTDKVLAIVPPIAAFVMANLEHSVANMFLIPYGLIIRYFAPPSFWESAGVDAAAFPDLTVLGLIANLVPATIGNIIGGVLLGWAYWFAYLRRSD